MKRILSLLMLVISLGWSYDYSLNGHIDPDTFEAKIYTCSDDNEQVIADVRIVSGYQRYDGFCLYPNVDRFNSWCKPMEKFIYIFTKNAKRAYRYQAKRYRDGSFAFYNHPSDKEFNSNNYDITAFDVREITDEYIDISFSRRINKYGVMQEPVDFDGRCRLSRTIQRSPDALYLRKLSKDLSNIFYSFKLDKLSKVKNFVKYIDDKAMELLAGKGRIYINNYTCQAEGLDATIKLNTYYGHLHNHEDMMIYLMSMDIKGKDLTGTLGGLVLNQKYRTTLLEGHGVSKGQIVVLNTLDISPIDLDTQNIDLMVRYDSPRRYRVKCQKDK
jgi:hypothetical protein